ncbi:negative elongation factor D [Rhizophagus clarus]|uniref:Negative elongation factor D n=1 Tax=Rhizophagus clarus TaxID=94130 RepID=A0A8H3QGX9_9GLOM|nr:negative elongation factor D [Rhizophagus clarus]
MFNNFYQNQKLLRDDPEVTEFLKTKLGVNLDGTEREFIGFMSSFLRQYNVMSFDINPIDFSDDAIRKTVQRVLKPDSLFEPGIQDAVRDYLEIATEGTTAIFSSLVVSYRGYPNRANVLMSMINAFSDQSQNNPNDPTARGREEGFECLKKVLKAKYDAKKIDETLIKNGRSLNPVLELIDKAEWRKVIYELSEKYPDSQFLNVLIQRIANQGFVGEIKHLKTASTYIGVYSKVLLDQFNTLLSADDASLSKFLPDLVKTASQHPHTYLFVQTLIKRLIQVPNGYPLRKLAKELEKGAIDGRNDLVTTLRNLLSAPPTAIASSILHIPPTPGDVVALYKQYNSKPPPSPIFLRDPQLLYWLLNNIFVPSEKNKNLKQDLKEKYLYLAAFASSAKELPNGKIDSSQVDSTFTTLKKLEAAVSKKGATTTEFGSIVKEILEYMDTPIASMALIFWIKHLLRDTSFYEKHFKHHEIPIPHLLLEEIAYRHPYQRTHVFNAFKAELESNSWKLTPEIMLGLRQQLLDRMIYLIQLGFVIQVMSYIEKQARKLEERLIIYFIKKVVQIIGPPYSKDFYCIMIKLIEPFDVVLEAQSDTRSLIRQFLADCPQNLNDKEIFFAISKLKKCFS